MAKRGILRPASPDGRALSNSLNSVATELDLLVQTGDLADRPTATGSLRFFYAADTNELFLDVEGSWVKIGGTITKADLDLPLGLTLGEA